MDVVRDCMESRAGELLRQQREEDQKIPVYPYPASYAREHGELEQYRASHRANIDCEVAIENAIAENYQNNVLPDAAAQQVVDLFGFDRTMFVLANTCLLYTSRLLPSLCIPSQHRRNQFRTQRNRS